MVSELKVAILGGGRMAQKHATAVSLQRVVKLVAVVDPFLGAEQINARFGTEVVAYDDVGQMLERERPDIVHVVTPPHTHIALARQCLLGGASVYVEKPFAMTQGEAAEILDLADGRGLKVCAAHQVLFQRKGEITRAPGLRQGVLEQEVPGAMPGTVFDVVAGGIGGLGRLVAEYHGFIARMEADDDPSLTRRLGEVQHRLEIQGGWQLDQAVTSVISRLELSPEASFGTLSAGLKRRTMLGRALVRKPDILLLDEPTNHLDMDSIGWMEEFLLRAV